MARSAVDTHRVLSCQFKSPQIEVTYEHESGETITDGHHAWWPYVDPETDWCGEYETVTGGRHTNRTRDNGSTTPAQVIGPLSD